MQTSSSDASLISDKSSTSTDTQSAATRSTASSSSSSLVSTIPVSVPDPEAGKSAATTTTTTGAAAAAPAKKHRSVRSLTREYETQTSEAASADGPTAFPLSSSPPSASSSANSLSPIGDRERRPSAGSFSSAHSRKPSVLLASPSYPSTLAVNEPHAHYQRQRTISGNSIRSNSGELARTPSVRLASPNYPSTFQQQQTSPTSPPQNVQPLPTRPSVTTSLSADSLSSGALSSSTSMSAAPSGRSTPMMHRRKKSSKDINIANGDASGHDMLPTLSVSFDGSDEQLDDNDAAGYDNDDKKAAAMHEDDDEAMDGLGELSDSASPKKAMSAAERRDHSRKHSRVHSRNLSVFFPRPGSEAEREADEIRANDNFDRQPHRIQTTGLVAQDTSSSGSSTSEGSALTANGLTVPLDDVGVPVSPTKSRRGHHRKHSVNHALFDGAHLQVGRGGSDIPLNDLPTPSTAASPWTASSFYDASDEPAHQHHHHSHHHHDAHAHSHTHEHANDKVAAAFPSSSSLHAALSEPLWASLPASHRPLFVFGLSHFALGAALWVSGQSGDSLSMTGLGYLVVFDALGILSSCGAEWFGESWKRQRESKALKRGAKRDHSSSRADELRRPYGSHRVETLLYFVQSIYLLFASVYVCKESIEHALLEGSEEHHEEDDVGLVLPTVMLVLATAVSLFSNLVLHNHAKLVAACGISTAASEAASSSPLSARNRRRGHGRAGSVLVDPKALAGPFLHLISNPFSLTVLFFSTVLALASIIMPPFQVAALDKVLAGMESAAMAYVAWPASKALGKVLLQTAPSVVAPLNVHLNRTIKTIEDHRLVTYVAPPNLWQLTPPTSALSAGAAVGLGSSANGNIAHASPSKLTSILPASSGLVGGAGASRTAKHAALVATLKIFIKDEATDDDVLDVTRWAWQLAAPSVGAGAGLKPGDTLRGSIRAGELIVEVQREGARDRYLASAKDKFGGRHHHHHDHDHHGHGHSHGHDDHHHDHDHHGHGHSHGHDDHHHDHHHDHAGHSHSSHAHHSHSHHDPSAHGHNGHSHHHDHSQPSHSEHQHSPHSHSHHHEDNHLHAAVPISTGPQHQQHLHNNHSHHH